MFSDTLCGKSDSVQIVQYSWQWVQWHVRVTDGKAPLLLDFFDGNWQNHKLDNLRFLCYNCFFLLIGKRKIPKDGQYVEQGIVGDEDEEENIEEDLEDSEI